MKSSQLRQIIKEEIVRETTLLREQLIINTIDQLKRSVVLRENIIAAILDLFIDRKYKKDVDSFKNSPEYKELTQQIKVASDNIENLTKRLTRSIDGYNKSISQMQKMGIKVKPGMDAIERFKAYKKWEAERAKKTGVEAINPDWKKYFSTL